jgi:hypothetical protein
MNVSPLNRLIAAAVLCSLLFQSCRPGLHAIIEEPVLKQGPPTPADHMQTSGEAMPSGALAVASSRTDARVSGMLGRVSPAELVSAVGPSSPQFFAEPFTASSGSRVLLSQQRGQWQAVLQGGVGTMMHRRALPVVGAGDIGASLAALRGVDAWSSRSRIHVLAMPTPPYSPCVYVGRLGLLGGMQAQQTQPPVEEQQLLFQIESSGKKDRVAYQIPSGYRYTGYRVKEKVLENVSFLKIYYVEANNEEEVRRLEALKNGRLIAGKVGASVNALFGYTVDLGSFEAGANSLIVKDRESIQVRRSKHAALVVEGGTKGKMLPLSQAKSCIKVLLEVCLAQDTTPPPDIPSSPTNAHNHAQPNFYTQYPHPQWDNFFHETQELRRDYESKLDAAQEQKRQLQRDYENKLDEVEEHKRQLARQTSLLKQKEAQLNTKAQEYKCLSEAHAALEASRAALEQECAERLSTAAEEHKRQLARQTSLLKQKEAQLNTKAQEYKCLSEAHAASQAALERKCAERLSTAAEEHERQLAHQTSLLKQKEAQLNTKAQEYKRLAEAHAASQAALERKCAEQLAAAEKAYKTHLVQVLVSSLAFGEKQWKQYFGEVGMAHSLPPEIGQILNSTCPFWPDKQVKDTHLLVLIPKEVDGQPFTLNLLGACIQSPKEGDYNTEYRYYHDDAQRVLGNQSSDDAYWVLMTHDVLPGSRGRTYAAQNELIAARARERSLPYEMPYALEAATVILSRYVRTGRPLYTDNPWTYTRCQDLVSVGDGNYPTVVGGFSASGLSISHDFFDDSYDDRNGVAGCLRFFRQP